MRLTDDKIWSIIRETLGGQPGEMTLNQIAIKAGCHRNTAYRAVHRLEAAGRLRIKDQGRAKCSYYEILEP